MEDQKLDNLLSLAFGATSEELEKSEELDVGYDQRERTWEVIVRYLYFSVSIGRTASCVYALQTAPYDLFGEGVLVAVIDSGERVIMMSVSKNPVNTQCR